MRKLNTLTPLLVSRNFGSSTTLPTMVIIVSFMEVLLLPYPALPVPPVGMHPANPEMAGANRPRGASVDGQGPVDAEPRNCRGKVVPGCDLGRLRETRNGR